MLHMLLEIFYQFTFKLIYLLQDLANLSESNSSLVDAIIYYFRSSGWTIDESKPEELLGYKLSLGLEILASRYRRPGDHQTEDASSTHFIKKLQGVGYFQGICKQFLIKT